MQPSNLITVSPTAPSFDPQEDIAVIARRLLWELAPAGTETPREGLLLERALAYAARAEQQIAQQSERIEVLESLSITDELTGLLNRRGFVQQLEREIAAARRYGAPGALLYGDLDGFKAINDGFGHGGGDRALRHVARLLSNSVRKVDIVGRLGGDEFGIVLVQADRRAAEKRARTLQWFIENTPVLIDGRSMTARISIGIEPFNGDEAIDELIAKADMAMYDRKRRKTGAHLRGAAE